MGKDFEHLDGTTSYCDKSVSPVIVNSNPDQMAKMICYRDIFLNSWLISSEKLLPLFCWSQLFRLVLSSSEKSLQFFYEDGGAVDILYFWGEAGMILFPSRLLHRLYPENQIIFDTKHFLFWFHQKSCKRICFYYSLISLICLSEALLIHNYFVKLQNYAWMFKSVPIVLFFFIFYFYKR